MSKRNSYVLWKKKHQHLNWFPFLYIIDQPVLVLQPPELIENGTALFRCEAKFGGPWNGILKAHFPYLKMYYAHGPYLALPMVNMTEVVNNTVIQVCNYIFVIY